jgi:hypothetical protein
MIVEPLARPVVAFTGGTLDRADHLRQDAAAMADLRSGGRLLLLDGIDPRLNGDALVWGEMAQADGAELVFLGVDGAGQGAFAPVPRPSGAALAPHPPICGRRWRVSRRAIWRPMVWRAVWWDGMRGIVSVPVAGRAR